MYIVKYTLKNGIEKWSDEFELCQEAREAAYFTTLENTRIVEASILEFIDNCKVPLEIIKRTFPNCL